jgi:hypothetical protein
VGHSTSEAILLLRILKVEMLAREASEVIEKIFNRIIEQRFITVVDLCERLMHQERPDLDLPILVFTNIHKGRYITVTLFDDWNAIIHCDVLPDAVMVYAQIVNAKAKHFLSLENSLKAAIAVRQGVASSHDVLALGIAAKAIDTL